MASAGGDQDCSRSKARDMDLKQTYENPIIHEMWRSAYRTNPLQARFNERILDRVLDLMTPAPECLFLDAGCGTGDHSLRIARRGYRCVGVDMSQHVLDQARLNSAKMGFQGRVSFACQKLQQLGFDDGTFDCVHCRGVLMHIPSWEDALRELCRVLKPGGTLAILETNHMAVESRMIRILRPLRKNKSRLVSTPGGAEFWAEMDGHPFVVRATNIRRLQDLLASWGVRTVGRIATEFWDIGRFPEGIVRNGAIRFNRCWFALHLPAALSAGNALVVEKVKV